MESPSPNDRRRGTRHLVTARVEFVLDSRTLEANAVDLSHEGMAFDIDEPPIVTVALTVDSQEIVRRARLLRLHVNDEGSYRLGLQFIDGAGESGQW